MSIEHSEPRRPFRALFRGPAPSRMTLALAFALICAPQAARGSGAVEHASGVVAHHGVDAIYQQFRQGYRTLEAERVAGRYTEGALYLQPGSDVIRGRDEILRGFRTYFDHVRSAGDRLDIGFEIVDRQVMPEAVVDVGIYTIRRSTEAGAEVRVTRGKFVTVAVEDDDEWRFRVDGFSPMPADDR